MKVGDIVKTKRWGNVGKNYDIRENPKINNYVITVIFYRYEIIQYGKSSFVPRLLCFDESELIKANLNEILKYNMSYIRSLPH